MVTFFILYFRWLITTAMDCTIRTWDIPSGQLVDIYRVSKEFIEKSAVRHLLKCGY